MINLKQHDTGIGIRATLSNENGAIDLTNASVLFFMGAHQISTLIVDAINGVVLINFNSLHTAVSDVFNAEFRVTYGDGKVETYPNDGYVRINIVKSLGGA